jgi:hypothetical protein
LATRTPCRDAGTNRAFTETLLKTGMQGAWTEGGSPTYAFMNGSGQGVASAFTGNATRFKKAEDQKLIASIDVYESDFGELQLVPHRLMDNRVLGLDTDYVEIGWLQPMNGTSRWRRPATATAAWWPPSGA